MLDSEKINQVRVSFNKELEKVNNAAEIEELRINYIGRKSGIITKLLNEIPTLSIAKRKLLAPEIINLKEEIENKLKKQLEKTSRSESKEKENKELDWKLDPSLSGIDQLAGHQHPTIKIIKEIKEIFHYLGFSWQDGPEIESDVYNFQKLRLPKEHPSRDTQQTLYLNEETLLRTQTSSMQIRYMESHQPPIRVLFPGRVYRREEIDATHLPAFYQIEGLLVDQNTKMTDLLGVLEFFAKRLFGSETKIRVYGHHFPYTEPSIEVEVLFEGKKWLEILGAGMVHPEVLDNCGIDSKRYRGWAFGMGPERIAMIKYGIEDIRLFYTNDLEFLEQF